MCSALVQLHPVGPSLTWVVLSGWLIALHCFLCVFPQVVDIMRVNVDKVLERDQKLSELDDRADALQAGASQFETSAAKLKNKYWWKNAKVRTSRRAYLNSKYVCKKRLDESSFYRSIPFSGTIT